MWNVFKKALSKSRINVKRKKPNQRYSYVLFYSNDGRVNSNWSGKRKDDMKKGIFHFKPGIDRGLVKRVNFRKNKKPGFTELMVERAYAENKETLQLWATFDIEITLIGNTLLRPGMHLFLDPSTVGMGSPSDLGSFSRSIGLGGYYLVTSVSNTISDGDWETNVIAVWQTSGIGSPPTKDEPSGPGKGRAPEAPRKVGAKQAKQAIGDSKKPVSKKKKTNKKGKKISANGGSPKYYVNAKGEYVYSNPEDQAVQTEAFVQEALGPLGELFSGGSDIQHQVVEDE